MLSIIYGVHLFELVSPVEEVETDYSNRDYFWPRRSSPGSDDLGELTFSFSKL